MRVLRGLKGAFVQFVGTELKIVTNSDGYVEINGKRIFYLDTAITANVTDVPAAATVGSIGYTTHATGRTSQFYSDGTKWQTL